MVIVGVEGPQRNQSKSGLLTSWNSRCDCAENSAELPEGISRIAAPAELVHDEGSRRRGAGWIRGRGTGHAHHAFSEGSGAAEPLRNAIARIDELETHVIESASPQARRTVGVTFKGDNRRVPRLQLLPVIVIGNW